MKNIRRTFFVAVALMFATIANAYNFSIGNISGTQGTTKTLSVSLNNETQDITAFAGDFVLPTGLEFVYDETEDQYDFTLSSRKTSSHMIQSNRLSNGNVRVTCYSSGNKCFTGTSGELFSGRLILKGEPGTYTVKFTNAYVTTTAARDISCPEVSFTVTIEEAPLTYYFRQCSDYEHNGELSLPWGFKTQMPEGDYIDYSYYSPETIGSGNTGELKQFVSKDGKTLVEADYYYGSVSEVVDILPSSAAPNIAWDIADATSDMSNAVYSDSLGAIKYETLNGKKRFNDASNIFYYLHTKKFRNQNAPRNNPNDKLQVVIRYHKNTDAPTNYPTYINVCLETSGTSFNRPMARVHWGTPNSNYWYAVNSSQSNSFSRFSDSEVHISVASPEDGGDNAEPFDFRMSKAFSADKLLRNYSCESSHNLFPSSSPAVTWVSGHEDNTRTWNATRYTYQSGAKLYSNNSNWMNRSLVFDKRNNGRIYKGSVVDDGTTAIWAEGTDGKPVINAEYYCLSVSADGKTLYANKGSRLNAVTRQIVAKIGDPHYSYDYYSCMSSSDCVNAQAVIFQHSEAAEALLNYKAHNELANDVFTAYIGFKADLSAKIPIDVAYDDAPIATRFLRPISPVSKNYVLQNAGTDLQTISMANVMGLTDCRDVQFVSSAYYSHYGITNIEIAGVSDGGNLSGNKNVLCELNNNGQLVSLADVSDAIELRFYEGNITTLTDGHFTFKNKSETLNECTIYIPVTVTYYWGKMTQYVTLTVKSKMPPITEPRAWQFHNDDDMAAALQSSVDNAYGYWNASTKGRFSYASPIIEQELMLTPDKKYPNTEGLFFTMGIANDILVGTPAGNNGKLQLGGGTPKVHIPSVSAGDEVTIKAFWSTKNSGIITIENGTSNGENTINLTGSAEEYKITVAEDGDLVLASKNVIYNEISIYPASMGKETINYTINATSGETVLAKIAEDEGQTNDKVGFAYSYWLTDAEGNLYKNGAMGTPFTSSVTLENGKNAYNVEYKSTGLGGVVYCAEAEEIEGSDPVAHANIGLRSSKAGAAWNAADIKLCSVKAGNYQISAVIFDGNKTFGHTVSFTIGDKQVDLVANATNFSEVVSDIITIDADADITWLAGGNPDSKGLDCVIIRSLTDEEVRAADIAEMKHSYVLVCDNYTGNGTVPRVKGSLFGSYHFLDVNGGSVATNKGGANLADPATLTALNGQDLEAFSAKYGKYGEHLNSLRLKNAQDVIAMKLIEGSKVIFVGQGNDKVGTYARIPKVATNAALTEGVVNAAPGADFGSTPAGYVYEVVVPATGTYYVGSYNGDMYLSYIIVEANEPLGTPMVDIGDQTYENGLWFKEVTCIPQDVTEEGETIRTVVTYTTDGSTPTAASPVYTAPIKVYQDAMVKFQAYYDWDGKGAAPAEDDKIAGADNEALVSFSFDAPSVTCVNGVVTVTSEYEGAKNMISLNGGEFEETSTKRLSESAVVTGKTKIINGSYATFESKTTSIDALVLTPITNAVTVTVSGSAVLDEEATAASTTGPVYAVADGVVNADKKLFFNKGMQFKAIASADAKNAKYQVPAGQEAYMMFGNDSRLYFEVGCDSVDVEVVCSKNSCRTLNEDDDEWVTTDRKCFVNVSGKTYGWDNCEYAEDGKTVTSFIPANEIQTTIKFGLKKGSYYFAKYSGTGNILISSIKIAPALITVDDTDLSEFDNVVYIEGAEAKVGSQQTLSLKMNNTVGITGFQCDVYLPEGIEVVKDEDDFYDISLSTERTTATKTNYFDSASQPDGSVRIMCSSTKSYTFSGNEGEVATITVNIAEGLEEGDYPLILKNIVLSDASANTYEVEQVKTTLSLSSYTLGDANNDTKINVGDFTAIANAIMGNPPASFVEKAADVNEDTKINVGDLTGVANLILYGVVSPSAAAKAANGVSFQPSAVSVEDCHISAGTEFTVAVDITGSYSFSGYQFDMTLPECISVKMNGDEPCAWLSTIRTNEKRTNFFATDMMNENTVRILAASTNGYIFEGNEGSVAYVTLVADKDIAGGDYSVSIDNIVLSANGGTYMPVSTNFTVQVGNATVINGVMSEDGNHPVYDLSGKMVKRSSSTSGLKKGVYIINGNKMTK